MIKQLFGAILGIDADEYGSDEAIESWENQRYLDENDLDGYDIKSDTDDDDDDNTKSKGWFGLW